MPSKFSTTDGRGGSRPRWGKLTAKQLQMNSGITVVLVPPLGGPDDPLPLLENAEQMRRTIFSHLPVDRSRSVQTCPGPVLPVMLESFFKYFSVVGGRIVNFPDSFFRQGEVGAA